MKAEAAAERAIQALAWSGLFGHFPAVCSREEARNVTM